MKYSFFLITICALFSMCDSPCNTPVSAIPFGFYISDSSNNDLFSQQFLGAFPRDSVILYYIDKGGIHKDSIQIEKRMDVAAGQNIYMISSDDVLSQSVAGIKTFYFRRSANNTDTIYFDERIATGSCHSYKLFAYKYNGMDMEDNNGEGFYAHVR